MSRLLPASLVLLLAAPVFATDAPSFSVYGGLMQPQGDLQSDASGLGLKTGLTLGGAMTASLQGPVQLRAGLGLFAFPSRTRSFDTGSSSTWDKFTVGGTTLAADVLWFPKADHLGFYGLAGVGGTRWNIKHEYLFMVPSLHVVESGSNTNHTTRLDLRVGAGWQIIRHAGVELAYVRTRFDDGNLDRIQLTGSYTF